MHMSAKLLSACITLLIVVTHVLATSIEVDSKIVFTKPFLLDRFYHDNLGANNFLLRACSPSNDDSQMDCEITGVPTDESDFQTCNLQINASQTNRHIVDVEGVFRFRNNKLLIHIKEEPCDQEYLRYGNWTSFSSFLIFDNCVPVNIVSSVDHKDGISFSIQKIVIYEDGFDVFLRDRIGEDATLQYQSYDINGNQIGNYTVLPKQLPYSSLDWIPHHTANHYYKRRLVSYGTEHSRGVAFTSGYHFYPNGSIIRFADDKFGSIMDHPANEFNEVDDGPFYTACIALRDGSRYFGEFEDIGCWQYDVDHARLAFKVQFTLPRQSKFRSIRNLSKGGFLLAICEKYTMTVHVIRPDRPTIIDSIEFRKDECPFKVTDFDEKTGKITVLRSEDARSTIDGGHYFTTLSSALVRSNYVLKNYAAVHAENM